MPKKQQAVVLDYEPQERQKLLHSAKARQILYGGAAGGGKSVSLRWDAVCFCVRNAGCQAYLFRRTRTELEQNHTKFIRTELPAALGQYSHDRKAFEFVNGSNLYFCYCDREDDVTLYQGAEMHWVGVDEASHLTEYQLNYLKTRNRLGSWSPTDETDKGFLPRFVMASNPGGVGHNYLKSIFIDKAPPETYFYDEEMRNPRNPDDKGWKSIFIPAKMTDNVYLDENYEASFSGLPAELADALRDGNWDAVVGQALHLLNRPEHMLRAFVPPRHWTHFMCIDWGSAHPFSVGWYAVSEGATLKAKGKWPDRYLPAGALIRYREWYGWNGKPNQGARIPAQQVAKGIIKREEGEVMDFRRHGSSTDSSEIKEGPEAELRRGSFSLGRQPTFYGRR